MFVQGWIIAVDVQWLFLPQDDHVEPVSRCILSVPLFLPLCTPLCLFVYISTQW